MRQLPLGALPAMDGKTKAKIKKSLRRYLIFRKMSRGQAVCFVFGAWNVPATDSTEQGFLLDHGITCL